MSDRVKPLLRHYQITQTSINFTSLARSKCIRKGGVRWYTTTRTGEKCWRRDRGNGNPTSYGMVVVPFLATTSTNGTGCCCQHHSTPGRHPGLLLQAGLWSCLVLMFPLPPVSFSLSGFWLRTLRRHMPVFGHYYTHTLRPPISNAASDWGQGLT